MQVIVNQTLSMINASSGGHYAVKYAYYAPENAEKFLLFPTLKPFCKNFTAIPEFLSGYQLLFVEPTNQTYYAMLTNFLTTSYQFFKEHTGGIKAAFLVDRFNSELSLSVTILYTKLFSAVISLQPRNTYCTSSQFKSLQYNLDSVQQCLNLSSQMYSNCSLDVSFDTPVLQSYCSRYLQFPSQIHETCSQLLLDYCRDTFGMTFTAEVYEDNRKRQGDGQNDNQVIIDAAFRYESECFGTEDLEGIDVEQFQEAVEKHIDRLRA